MHCKAEKWEGLFLSSPQSSTSCLNNAVRSFHSA